MASNTSSHVDTSGWTDERRRLDQALADAMRVVWDVLRALAVDDRLAMITLCRSVLNTIEARAIAEQLEAGMSTRKVEDMLHKGSAGKASKATVKKAAKRGNVVRENPELSKKLASGSLSTDQLDVLANASDKTDGDAAHDTELIDKIEAAPPEQAKKIADKYVTDRMTQDEVDSTHARARKRRRVTRYPTDRGTDVIAIEGAPADIDEIEERIDALADSFYRTDGGRDVAAGAHRRTRDQRRFDAAAALIGAGANEECEESTDANATVERKPARRSWKTTMVITASLDQALGNDASPVALADGKVLPTPVIERLACGADFVGQIFGANGEVLWQGRAVRDCTYAQRLALISRDGGCVRCNANVARCEVHHLIPWTSRMLGKTDVDNMALVCQDCHHHIHDNELTLYRGDGGVWRFRKATPEEVAPRRASAERPHSSRGTRRAHPSGTRDRRRSDRNLVRRE